MASLRDTVIDLKSQGYTNAEIGDLFGVTNRTVQRYASGEIQNVATDRRALADVGAIISGNEPIYRTSTVGRSHGGIAGKYVDVSDLPVQMRQQYARNLIGRGRNFRQIIEVPPSPAYPEGLKSLGWERPTGKGERWINQNITQSTAFIVHD